MIAHAKVFNNKTGTIIIRAKKCALKSQCSSSLSNVRDHKPSLGLGMGVTLLVKSAYYLKDISRIKGFMSQQD